MSASRDLAPSAGSPGSPADAEPQGGSTPHPADSSAFRIPKRQAEAWVKLRGEEPRSILLHLAERAETHAGPERPSDLLAGSRDFVPVAGTSGGVLFLSTHAIVWLTVPARLERGLPDGQGSLPEGNGPAEGEVEEPIVLHLDDGSRLSGRVRYVPPRERPRLLDLLNGADPFLELPDDDVIHLVNKRRVAWVATGAET